MSLVLKCLARSTGFQPVIRILSESRPAVRPRANHAGRRACHSRTPRLTALGLDECLARSTGFQPVPNMPQVENLRYDKPHGVGLGQCPARSTGFQPVPNVPQVENLRSERPQAS